ncbi:hypothetical protein Ciccas_014030, partial [Cichlidogyrus casuarinus]
MYHRSLLVKELWTEYWRFVYLLVYPIVLAIPCAIVGTKLAAGTFCLFLIAGLWILEVLPIHITALLPIVLAPTLGVVPSRVICREYTSDTIFLFVGGIIIALAVENSQLHKRISIFVVKLVGTDKRMMLLGFMVPTWFLSMWINNTAATVMMVTIVNSVLSSLEQGLVTQDLALKILKTGKREDFAVELEKMEEPLSSELEEQDQAYREDIRKFGVALSLCTCYSATCGGIATLTGTAPNAVLRGIVTTRYGAVDNFTFSTWMAYAFPISFLQLIFTWIILMLIYIGPRWTFTLGKNRSSKALELERRSKAVIDQEARNLGPMTFQEISAGFLFLT